MCGILFGLKITTSISFFRVFCTVMFASSLHYNISFSWSTVAPLLIIVIMTTLAVLCMCYVAHVDEPVPFADDTFDDDESIIKEFVSAMGHRNYSRQGFFCSLLTCGFVFMILLLIRITNTADISYVSVFIPIFIGVGISCCLPIFFRRDRLPLCAFTCVMMSAPLLAFTIMLAMRLDGTDIKMVYVFIPLWIWNALTLCAACAITIGDREPWPIPIWCVAVVPMLVFEVLIAIYFDSGNHGMSFPTMFIPFYFWEFLWCMGGCAVGVEFLSKRFDLWDD